MRITKRLKGIMSAQRWVKKFKLPNHTPHSIQQTLSKESHRGYFRLNRAIEEAASCSDRKREATQSPYNYSGITRPSHSNYMLSRTIIPHNDKTIPINSKQIRHFIKRLLNSNNQFSDSSDKQALYDLQQLGSNNKNYNAVKTKQRTRNIHRPNSSTLKNKRRRIFILRR